MNIIFNKFELLERFKVQWKTKTYYKWIIKCINCWFIKESFLNSNPWCRECNARMVKKEYFDDHIEIYIKWWVLKIDIDDLPKIENNKWYVTKRKSIEARINWKLVKIHRKILWVVNPLLVVDHINWDIMDNRKLNLRICSQSDNMKNTKVRWKETGKTSIYKWVYRSRNKWVWRITANKITFSKIFDDEKDAVIWYNDKAKELFWEYARINNI